MSAGTAWRAYAQIHLCVLLWGLTAILGKLITLPAPALVWWRMLIVAGVLALWPPVWRALGRVPVRRIAIWGGIGVVVALHWLTFYAAIKLANASVAATCMALGAVFAALLEPRLHGGAIDRRQLLLGVVALSGVALVVGGVPGSMLVGLGVGVVSALLTSVFTVLNKRHAAGADALAVTLVEMVCGWLFVGLALPLIALLPATDATLSLPDARDALLLAVLALVCTLLPFALSLVALRQLSAFSLQLAVNLEPVYAIVLAIALLGEHRELGLAFYFGVAMILAAVMAPVGTRPRRTVSDALD